MMIKAKDPAPVAVVQKGILTQDSTSNVLEAEKGSLRTETENEQEKSGEAQLIEKEDVDMEVLKEEGKKDGEQVEQARGDRKTW